MPNENPTANDWASSRGTKWSIHAAATEATLQPVDEPLLNALRLDAPYRVADIGCGAGATTLEILRRAPAGSIVHGFDLSPDSIGLARTRKPAGEQRVNFEIANVATVAAPAQLYDRLVSRFGIMFFDDPLAAFTSLAHWLRPGGRFAYAVWGPLAENPWMTTVRDAVGKIIELPAPDPDAPGPFRYADAGKLLALLTASGFVKPEVFDWRGTFIEGGGMTAAQAAGFMLASYSTFAEQLAAAGDGAMQAARQLLAEQLMSFEDDGVVRLAACVHIVTGSR